MVAGGEGDHRTALGRWGDVGRARVRQGGERGDLPGEHIYIIYTSRTDMF